MQRLVQTQDPSQRRPVCQYSKGQAPLRQSPATAGSHAHLAVITPPPAPPVLNNLAGVSPDSAPTCRVRPPSVCQHSARIHRCHCLFGFFSLPPLFNWGRSGSGGCMMRVPRLLVPVWQGGETLRWPVSWQLRAAEICNY